MGARKRIAADNRKEAKRTTCTASLNGRPTSPRKMRLVADLVRGVDVNKALNILQHNSKFASKSLEKLLTFNSTFAIIILAPCERGTNLKKVQK
jgi:large subunit ribosomal protein L22